LPVASIPPSAPPEHGDATPISIFAVLTGTPGGTAALAIRLRGCSTTVGVDRGPDICAERTDEGAAGSDASTPPVLTVPAEAVMLDCVVYAATSLGALH
jgi:hypothetical protein